MYWNHRRYVHILKFGFAKKAARYQTISHLIWRLLSKYQIKWEIVSNFWRISSIKFFTLCREICLWCSCLDPKYCWQLSHWNGFILSWTTLICLFKFLTAKWKSQLFSKFFFSLISKPLSKTNFEEKKSFPKKLS